MSSRDSGSDGIVRGRVLLRWLAAALRVCSAGSWKRVKNLLILPACARPAFAVRSAWVSRLATRLQRRASQQPVPRPVAAASASPAACNTASSSASSTEASSANSGFGGLPATALSAPSPQLQQSMDALFSVYCLLDAEQLKQQTKMLDLEGFNFRKGASIIATTGPSGKILLQGVWACISPTVFGLWGQWGR